VEIGATSKFWSDRGSDENDGPLLIIATTYRPGGHEAKKPTSFVPIINALEELHRQGYVHGDIRAFNTVFGEGENPGCLIDFDFGGRAKGVSYPRGYRRTLDDGARIGEEGHKICKWHDWYALGKLIFDVHELEYPAHADQNDREFLEMQKFWRRIVKDPSHRK
jgi:serine/threonine protein kinase